MVISTYFAHAGHSHEGMGSLTTDHCFPVYVGAGIIITILVSVIIYLLTTWHPKRHTSSKHSNKKLTKR